jgi:hypothetical protein
MSLRETNATGRRRRPRLTYANVMSTLALFFALAGGSAFAATKLITGKQIAAGTITAKNIKAKSLLAKDFANKQLPAGARGATGAPGATGAQGPAGAAGAAGAPGAPGAAVAYGYAASAGSGAGVGFGAATLGFTSVTEPSPGEFCVSPVFKNSAGTVIEPDVSLAGTNSALVTWVDPQQCGGAGNAYEIWYADPSSGSLESPPSGDGFSISVP